jgi:hypothetical protein
MVWESKYNVYARRLAGNNGKYRQKYIQRLQFQKIVVGKMILLKADKLAAK